LTKAGKLDNSWERTGLIEHGFAQLSLSGISE